MKEKKDILILCQFFYPEYISSATLPFDTAKYLVEKGYSVSCMCGYPHEYTDLKKVKRDEIVDGIEINRLKYLHPSRKSKIGRLINYFSFFLSVFFKRRKLKKYKTIIVYSNPPLLLSIVERAKRKYGCRVVFVCYDVYPDVAIKSKVLGEGSFITKYMNKINNRFFSVVDDVVVLSSEMKKYLLEHRNIREDRIKVIPNWYKDEFSEKVSDQNNIFCNDFNDKVVVSYLGNMGTVQDIDTILKVAKCLENDERFVFLFAGHGNKVEEVKKAIENGAKNIYLYGFLHGNEYEIALNISKVTVVSLNCEVCGTCCPSKTYAYMMQNKPLIAIIGEETDIGQDVVSTNSGVVACNGDVDKIVNYLLEGNYQSNLRKVYLEKYTPEVCLQKYYDLIKRKD